MPLLAWLTIRRHYDGARPGRLGTARARVCVQYLTLRAQPEENRFLFAGCARMLSWTGARGSGGVVKETGPGMLRSLSALTRRASLAGLLVGAGALLSACAGVSVGDMFNSGQQQPPPPQAGAMPPQATPGSIGEGQVRVALILPLSATGNAGLAAQSMKNAAELALAEFNSPNVQLLVKDDGGSAPGPQAAAQQAIEEGAEIIIGPLFAQSVGAAAQVARARGIPIGRRAGADDLGAFNRLLGRGLRTAAPAVIFTRSWTLGLLNSANASSAAFFIDCAASPALPVADSGRMSATLTSLADQEWLAAASPSLRRRRLLLPGVEHVADTDARAGTQKRPQHQPEGPRAKPGGSTRKGNQGPVSLTTPPQPRAPSTTAFEHNRQRRRKRFSSGCALSVRYCAPNPSPRSPQPARSRAGNRDQARRGMIGAVK